MRCTLSAPTGSMKGYYPNVKVKHQPWQKKPEMAVLIVLASRWRQYDNHHDFPEGLLASA